LHAQNAKEKITRQPKISEPNPTNLNLKNIVGFVRFIPLIKKQN